MRAFEHAPSNAGNSDGMARRESAPQAHGHGKHERVDGREDGAAAAAAPARLPPQQYRRQTVNGQQRRLQPDRKRRRLEDVRYRGVDSTGQQAIDDGSSASYTFQTEDSIGPLDVIVDFSPDEQACIENFLQARDDIVDIISDKYAGDPDMTDLIAPGLIRHVITKGRLVPYDGVVAAPEPMAVDGAYTPQRQLQPRHEPQPARAAHAPYGRATQPRQVAYDAADSDQPSAYYRTARQSATLAGEPLGGSDEYVVYAQPYYPASAPAPLRQAGRPTPKPQQQQQSYYQHTQQQFGSNSSGVGAADDYAGYDDSDGGDQDGDVDMAYMHQQADAPAAAVTAGSSYYRRAHSQNLGPHYRNGWNNSAYLASAGDDDDGDGRPYYRRM